VISEDDPLCIGNLTWDPDVRDLLSRADLLLGIGTRYQGPNTENWKMELPRNLAQIDVAPEVPGRNYEPALAVRGDARSVLSALLDRLSDGPAASQDWLAEVAAVRQTARARLRATLGGQEALLDELSAAIGPETVVVKDATIPAYTWGNRLLPVRRARTSVMPNGFGIGLGLPHALGAAVATTGRGGSGAPVVLMAGDGGFMLAATELATVAEEGLPLLVLLFVDGGYGILRNIQDKQYGRRIGVDLGHPDFCALSRSLGVEAEPVSSPSQFGKAVRWALDRGLPYLIEVDLSAMADMSRPYTGTSKPPPGAAG
jgi:acetolactate synthase-1/2/3 large subunit